jgi:glutaredoxin-related protein
MSDYSYLILYGTETNNGRIVNPQGEPIESANVLKYLKNIQYPYVDLIKFSKTDTGNTLYSKMLYMHYKPECPFTAQAIDTILKFPNGFVLRLWNIQTNGAKTLNIVRQYLSKRGIKSTSFPQFFYKGEPLGGSDKLGQSLSQIFGVS